MRNKKKRAVRANSNVFAMFDQRQIGEFKEAFSMIDHDQDGFIDKDDLKDMLASLGLNPSDQYIDEMIADAKGNGTINFTVFLTLFGERLIESDPENEIMQAFEAFDDKKTGYIDADVMREALTSMGERFKDDEVDTMFRGAPVDHQNRFNYREWVRVLKHGE
ncbi:hypothetical protein BC828DRAFT_349140 [Blastocladiella britannica]|nr:hypothetical protein BC828DRAFT_349140 [Blastocladiella britannica]